MTIWVLAWLPGAFQFSVSGSVSITDYIVNSLCDALKRAGSHVLDIITAWDVSGDGHISAGEFRKTIRALGFKATNDELDAAFFNFEFVDRATGSVSYKDLHRYLRYQPALIENGGSQELSINQRGNYNFYGMTEDETMEHEAEQLDASSLDELCEQTAKPLTKYLTRVMDLFKKWDEDQSGTIDRREFVMAVRSLGVKVPKESILELFDQFDVDLSGEIDYRELNKRLRRRMEIDEKLKAGAAGEITLKAKNKYGSKRVVNKDETQPSPHAQCEAERRRPQVARRPAARRPEPAPRAHHAPLYRVGHGSERSHLAKGADEGGAELRPRRGR